MHEPRITDTALQGFPSASASAAGAGAGLVANGHTSAAAVDEQGNIWLAGEVASVSTLFCGAQVRGSPPGSLRGRLGFMLGGLVSCGHTDEQRTCTCHGVPPSRQNGRPRVLCNTIHFVEELAVLLPRPCACQRSSCKGHNRLQQRVLAHAVARPPDPARLQPNICAVPAAAIRALCLAQLHVLACTDVRFWV